jgi:hypothetical protein
LGLWRLLYVWLKNPLLATNQKVVGSNPAGLTKKTLTGQQFCKGFLFHIGVEIKLGAILGAIAKTYWQMKYL